MAGDHGRQLVDEAPDALPVFRRQPVDEGDDVGDHRPELVHGRPAPVVREADDQLAPIVRMALAGDVTALGEAVDYRRDRPAPHVQPSGEIAWAEVAVHAEVREGEQLGWRHVHVPRDVEVHLGESKVQSPCRPRDLHRGVATFSHSYSSLSLIEYLDD
jgi:hypothetical protein